MTMLSKSLKGLLVTRSSCLTLSPVPCRCAHAVFQGGKRAPTKTPPQPRKAWGDYFPVSYYNPQPEGLLGWTDWAMKKDARRRRSVKAWGATHKNLKAFKQSILPREITEIAIKDMHDMPRECLWQLCMERCAITSKPDNVVPKWRLSRFIFRHLADYNKLSGVRRGRW